MMRMQAIFSSIALHSAVLVFGSAVLVTPAQYGVEEGVGGLDVDLVAAPLPADIPVEAPATEPEPIVQEVESADDLIRTDESISKEQALPTTSVHGDGSSAVPGQDATTQQASSGAWMEAKPKYLRNPAPRYPESARRRGEEGSVILVVDVDSEGRVIGVVIKRSSGYASLDESALKSVRKWKFEPARAGAMALDSKVEVPIRFKLNE